jgi:thiol-disulfide isomerase/thioredoxin
MTFRFPKNSSFLPRTRRCSFGLSLLQLLLFTIIIHASDRRCLAWTTTEAPRALWRLRGAHPPTLPMPMHAPLPLHRTPRSLSRQTVNDATSFGSSRSSVALHMGANNNNYQSKTGARLLNSPEDYAAFLADSARPVLVFWTAPWCGPCRLSIPVVKDVVHRWAGTMDAVEICTDDWPQVAADAGVLSIPTIHLYYQGALFFFGRRIALCSVQCTSQRCANLVLWCVFQANYWTRWWVVWPSRF